MYAYALVVITFFVSEELVRSSRLETQILCGRETSSLLLRDVEPSESGDQLDDRTIARTSV